MSHRLVFAPDSVQLCIYFEIKISKQISNISNRLTALTEREGKDEKDGGKKMIGE